MLGMHEKCNIQLIDTYAQITFLITFLRRQFALLFSFVLEPSHQLGPSS